MSRPPRAKSFEYVGYWRYFVTTCTFEGQRLFVDAAIVDSALSQFFQAGEAEQNEILAYCFMPDHVHVLLDARDDSAALRDVVKRWKQASGYWYARRFGRTLWQSGYFERILRREETTELVANYILANPVRTGLAKHVGEYPYAWALVSTGTRGTEL